MGVVGYGVTHGWFDSGSVEGTTSGFEPEQAPTGSETAGSWPEWGYDAARSRANPALDIAPPFRRLWSFDAGSLVEFPPVIAGGRAIVGTNYGLAYALDIDTGKVVWKTHTRGRVASSPAIDGTRVLFTTKRGDVLALDAAHRRGVVAAARGVGHRVVAARRGLVVLHRDALPAGDEAQHAHRRGALERPRPRRDQGEPGALRAATSSWATTPATSRRSGDPTDGRCGSAPARASGCGAPGRFYAGPAVAYGRVYIGNVNGRVLALDADTGEVAWVRVLDDFVYSSAAVADRTVFLGSYDRHFYALDAVTGRVRWSVDAGERISGSPSVVGGLVWFSTLARRPSDGRTLALDVRTGKRRFAFPDGRYSPAVAIEARLVLTGVRTLYGFAPR